MNNYLKQLLQDFESTTKRCDLGNIHSNKKTLLQLCAEITKYFEENSDDLKNAVRVYFELLDVVTTSTGWTEETARAYEEAWVKVRKMVGLN